MELGKLFSMQRELDRHIEEKHQLQKEDLFERKVLALMVELGELANETRCFKFWSIKEASPKAVIIEEFVDGIHFILSLGIECGFDGRMALPESSQPPEYSLSEAFLCVYQSISLFRETRAFSDYQRLFGQYLQLASHLGFPWEEIIEAYIVKNEVNYERQRQGY